MQVTASLSRVGVLLSWCVVASLLWTSSMAGAASPSSPPESFLSRSVGVMFGPGFNDTGMTVKQFIEIQTVDSRVWEPETKGLWICRLRVADKLTRSQHEASILFSELALDGIEKVLLARVVFDGKEFNDRDKLGYVMAVASQFGQNNKGRSAEPPEPTEQERPASVKQEGMPAAESEAEMTEKAAAESTRKTNERMRQIEEDRKNQEQAALAKIPGRYDLDTKYQLTGYLEVKKTAAGILQVSAHCANRDKKLPPGTCTLKEAPFRLVEADDREVWIQSEEEGCKLSLTFALKQLKLMPDSRTVHVELNPILLQVKQDGVCDTHCQKNFRFEGSYKKTE